MKTQVTRMNKFLLGLLKVAGYVSIAYLANLMVAEWFGGVNPLLEFSTGGFSKVESLESKNRSGMGMAYQACKDGLGDEKDSYEFPDESYDVWNLSDGRYLIESRIYSHGDSGSSVAANLVCRVMKTEDTEYLAIRWKVQGVQVSYL